MGLLSDPQKRQKILEFLVKWRKSLSILGYIGGIVWIFLLATDEFSSNTPLSEHALLPGLVQTKYSEDQLASRHYHELSKICNDDIGLVRNWLENELVASGLEVFHQNYTCGHGKARGKNIYGILRSARSSGVESLVLNVPLKPGCQSNGGIALMLSVAHYFRQLSFWEKDIIFLVTENESCGIAAWLEAYHGEKSKDITSSELIGHGGAILAALVIDFPSDSINGIDVHPQGVNGRLPDLDLVHMAFIIARSENIPVKLHTEDNYFGYLDPLEEYLRRLKTLARMILLQASGYTTGGHGVYLKYRIESITLKASEDSYSQQSISLLEMGRLVEAVFRSFNNLLEHFHQSFFFYLLPTMERFLSISVYMRALGGVLLGPLLYSITLWIEIFVMDFKDSDKSKPDNGKVASSFSWKVPLLFLASHVAGVLLFLTMSNLMQDQPRYFTEGNPTIGFAVSSVILLLTLCIIKPLRRECDWKLLKFVTVVYLTLVIVTSSMLNFSLGFLLAIAYVPVTLIVEIDKKRLNCVLKCILVILCSPVSLLIIFAGLHLFLSRDNTPFLENPLGESIRKSDCFLQQAFADDYQDVWTSSILSLAVFPIWLNIAMLASPLKS